MTLPAGTRLGPYEILSPLGEGGMGEVYRARDTRLAREVAVKVLPERFARDSLALSRFEREARAIAALSHPNILDVHDFGSERGISYLVTELLEGEPLSSRLCGAPIPWRVAREIGLAIAEGLAFAHEHGIVHRDLKPANVFLTFDGRVKILDFGLARVDVPESTWNPESSPTAPAATETGTLLGTVGYMSPEQARGKKADARSDIFSLGCVLYEMVAGRRAFSGDGAAETLAAILREEPTDPSDLVPGLPEQVRLVIVRCLSKYPESRFQSARDLAFALKVSDAETAPVVATRPGRARSSRTLLLAAAGSIAAALVAFGVYNWVRRPGPIDSLAVLPFTNTGNDPNAEYLSAGITESVINSLLQLPRLRVIPRASVYQYRGGQDPLKAGREFGVRAVLTGNVSQVGDSLVVQAELTDVKNASALWGKRFQQKLSDAFTVQESIAQEILKSLRLRLSGEEEQRLTRRYTQDVEAYKLYLKGRFYWNKRTPDGIAKSIEVFDQAIVRDPNYALAYAGLANSYLLVAFYGALPPKDILPKAREAARRALELDDRLAEAHAVVADVGYLFDWDWESAERGFRRAIELNPNYPTAHQWYANYLAVLLRNKEACVEMARAEELDPLDPVISMDVGLTCYYTSGDYEKAIDQYRKVLELHPDFPLAHLYLALAHIRKNELPEAHRELETVKRLEPGEPDPIALLGYVFAVSGRRREAEQALAELREISKRRYVSPFPVAWIYLGLQDRDRAFEWLHKALAERAGRIVYLKSERAFDFLRSDPRFDALLRRLNFPA